VPRGPSAGAWLAENRPRAASGLPAAPHHLPAATCPPDPAMPSCAPAPATGRTAAIQDELDQARRRGSLQHIVIPPCPTVLMRLQDAMAAAEPDLHAVAHIAGTDVAMAAVLMRQANSPLYAAGQPVRTIGQAMDRLGLDETAAVLTAFAARHAIRADSPHLKRFWECSTKRSLAMAWIARQLPGLSPDIARTYGLFCHVGLPVLLQSVKGYAGTMVEAQARIDRPYVATENANHRTDHAVVGALVARLWRLAPEVMAAIRLHHDLAALGDGATEPEVHTLVAAGLVAEHLARCHEGLSPDADWQAHAGRALGWLQVSADDVDHWHDALVPVLDQA
jgi:HD-like signal output (HDOD) protein